MNHTLVAPRAIAVVESLHLGDALMVLPLAGALRRRWPQAKIFAIGADGTRPLWRACEFFDAWLSRDEVLAAPETLRRHAIDILVNPYPDDEVAHAAHHAGVPIRPGNLLRKTVIHCNRFVAYNRTICGPHIMSFRLRHLRALGFVKPERLQLEPDVRRLYGLTRVPPLAPEFTPLLAGDRFNLILHPKSGGSGREWPLANYLDVAQRITANNAARVFVTGSQRERETIHAQCPQLVDGSCTTDLCGRLSLEQLIAFVAATDAVVAASTGPLHLAAALGRGALGLFARGLGLAPETWAPIGPHALSLCPEGYCEPGKDDCPGAKGPPCPCMRSLGTERVMTALETLFSLRHSADAALLA